MASRLKHILGTGGGALLGEWAHCPVCASPTWSVQSWPPETMCLPTVENVTLETLPACPLRVSSSCPVCASHTLTVASSPPDTIRLLSAENATLVTVLVCPWRVSFCC